MTVALLALAFAIGVPAAMAWLTAAEPVATPVARPRQRALDSHRVAIAVTLLLWGAMTAIGVYFAATVSYYPLVISDKGEEIEHAFRVLTIMAAPVAAGVLAVLVYTFVRRGSEMAPPEDGPPLEGRGTAPAVWFAVTAGLTLLVMVYPGLTSLSKIVGVERNPDLVIQVEGRQWTWLVSYPDHRVENVRELVLPVDQTVRFDITSIDVLHSFWVPAFLMKIDAVPGRTTQISLRATHESSFEKSPQMRLQCAELCGVSHGVMAIPVRVVSQREFEAWLREKRAAASR